MDVDVIILTKSEGKRINLTRRTIHTLHDSESEHTFKIHLVESSNNHESMYRGIVSNYILPNEPFNYNRFLNIASQKISCDWVVVSNNDVSYERGWFSEILKVHELRKDIQSFSPKDPNLYMLYFPNHFIGTKDLYFESYLVSEAFMGWSFAIKREVLEKLIPLDEDFDMYYQDNDLVERLKLLGVKHALVRNSIAVHYETNSVGKIDESKRAKMSEDEIKFRKKWNYENMSSN
jgi:GT2 family glycosyltransferase